MLKIIVLDMLCAGVEPIPVLDLWVVVFKSISFYFPSERPKIRYVIVAINCTSLITIIYRDFSDCISFIIKDSALFQKAVL